MAHQAQREFFRSVQEKYPQKFKDVKVIDCGSLDVNGTAREFFTNPDYLGVDIVDGRNVDRVSHIHKLEYKEEYDTVISGEMLEHSQYWREDMLKMYEMLKHGGLLVFTAAGEGRPEHGTIKTGAHWGTAPDYYRNITEEDIRETLNESLFDDYTVKYNPTQFDIYFSGIKK